MTNKQNYNFKNPNHAKTYYMKEAWEYFKKREKLPQNTDRLDFELSTKETDLGERWGAFKHTYTSAAFTKNFGEAGAKFLGDANEIIQFGTYKAFPKFDDYAPGNEPQDRRMDLKNNAAGRDIASKNSGLNLLDEVYYNLDRNHNIVLNQRKNNDEAFNDNFLMNQVWDLADKGYKNKEKINNVKNFLTKEKPTGGAASIDEEDYYDRKARVLDDLMAPQNDRIQMIHDAIQGKSSTVDDVDYEGFKNKEGKNVIFTQEQIDEMNDDEFEKNIPAINHQKREIGIPSKKEAESSGLVHVEGYTRSDGVKVGSYYRARPHFG